MMDLFIILLSSMLLACGLLNSKESYLIAGALLYIFIELIGLIRVYRDAKSYREGEWLENTNTAITGHIVYWLKTLIVLGGLYLILDYEKSLLSGAIIWIGTIACYFVAGVITSNVANLPLRMGYGGWHIKRPSKKKKTQ